MIKMIVTYREPLLELFGDIIDESAVGDWNGCDRVTATGFKTHLESFDFNFLLATFDLIYGRVEQVQ